MDWIVCVPAYGRDYLTPKAVRADWNAGKDFLMVSVNSNGGYINKEDADKHGVTVELRYNKRAGFVVIRPENKTNA